MKEDAHTEQLNLRMPKALLQDIDLIASTLHVNKAEWIKTRLSEIVYEEKSRLLQQYVSLHEKGIIDKKQLDQLIQIHMK